MKTSFSAACLLLAFAAANLKVLRGDFLPIHEALESYQVFHLYYGEFFRFRELARWLPFHAGGAPTGALQSFLGPAQWLCLFSGAFLGIGNTLALYYASMALDQLLFLGGLWLLSGRLYRREETRLFVCLGGLATVFWEVHTGFNFRLVQLWPFVVYFLLRFFEEGPIVWLWASLLALAQTWTCCDPQAAPFLAFAFASLFLALARFAGAPRAFLARKPFSPASLAALGTLAALVGIQARHLFVVSHAAVFYPLAGEPAGAKVPLERFLREGLPRLGRYCELLYAVPADQDLTFYIGSIPLAFLAMGLAGALRPAAKALWMGAYALAFLSWIHEFAAGPALSLPVLKTLLLLLSGFGLDRYLLDAEGPSGFVAFLAGLRFHVAAAVLAALVLALDIFVCRFIPPYDAVFPARSSIDPGAFHFIPLLSLCLLSYALMREPRRRVFFIFSCFVLEISSYHSWLSLSSPAHAARLPESLFKARPWRHPSVKSGEEPSGPELRAADDLSRRWGSKFPTMDSFLGTDRCALDERVGFVSPGIDRLARARLGLLPLNRTSFGEAESNDILSRGPFLRAVEADAAFRRSLGCGAPKLRLLSRAAYGGDPESEALKIRNNPEIDQTAYLRGAAEGLPESPAGAKSLPCRGTVEVSEFRANAVTAVADVSTGQGCWLVYSDAYDPGWSARVNGRPTPIAEANFAYKAVRLEKGRSIVEFEFEGPDAVWGRLLAVWGAVACLLALAVVWLGG